MGTSSSAPALLPGAAVRPLDFGNERSKKKLPSPSQSLELPTEGSLTPPSVNVGLKKGLAEARRLGQGAAKRGRMVANSRVVPATGDRVRVLEKYELPVAQEIPPSRAVKMYRNAAREYKRGYSAGQSMWQ